MAFSQWISSCCNHKLLSLLLWREKQLIEKEHRFSGQKTPNPQLAIMHNLLVESREGNANMYRNVKGTDNVKINGWAWWHQWNHNLCLYYNDVEEEWLPQSIPTKGPGGVFLKSHFLVSLYLMTIQGAPWCVRE